MQKDQDGFYSTPPPGKFHAEPAHKVVNFALHSGDGNPPEAPTEGTEDPVQDKPDASTSLDSPSCYKLCHELTSSSTCTRSD